MSRAADKMIRDAKRTRSTLDVLSDALLADLVRRAGTRATSEPTESTGPRGKGHYSDPTLSAVTKKMSKGTVADPVWDSVRDIATMLDDMASLCQRIDQRVRFVTETGERAKESTIIHCNACEREVAGTSRDRIRSGYCQACYASWIRAGRPYRAVFEIKIREKNNEAAEKAQNNKENQG
jgi:hypothetical protein